MTGIPVVVVDKGGIPVKKVDERAPVMKVAGNGFGVPITYSDLGAPFIVNGDTPPPPVFDPLTLFGGGYTGRLYDLKKARMWVDDGVTLASAGQSVQRIEDLTGGSDAVQAESAFRGVLQADGSILSDGVDDFYSTGLVPYSYAVGQTVITAIKLPSGTSPECFFGARQSNANQFIKFFSAGYAPQFTLGSTVVHQILPNEDQRDKVVVAAVRYKTTLGKFSIGKIVGDDITLTGSPGPLAQYLFGYNAAGVPTRRGKFNLYGLLIINRQLTDAEVFDVVDYWSE